MRVTPLLYPVRELKKLSGLTKLDFSEIVLCSVICAPLELVEKLKQPAYSQY